MKKILPLILVFLCGFFLKVEAQCPPTVTIVKHGDFIDTDVNKYSLCSGDSIQLTASPSTGVTYQWYQNNFPIPDSTRVHFWAAADGSYTVKVLGCATASSPIVIIHKKQPSFTISSVPSPPHICAQQSIELTVSSSVNSSWLWSTPGSLRGKDYNPVVIPNLKSTTVFQVQGSDTITNCASLASIKVTVDDIIVGGVIQSDQTICAGATPDPLTETTPSSGGDISLPLATRYTYSWEQSSTGLPGSWTTIAGASATLKDYSPVPLSQTTYFQRNTFSPPCSKGTSNVVIITVDPIPVITSSLSTVICSGSNLNYQPVSNVTGTSFNWIVSGTTGGVIGANPGSGTSPIADVLTLPVNSYVSGTVSYTITPTGPAPTLCPGIPVVVTVTVNPIPNVKLSAPQTICSGGTTTVVTLTSDVPNVTWGWNTDPPLVGMTPTTVSGTSASLPAQKYVSTLTGTAYVVYNIIATGPGTSACASSPVTTYMVTVNPSPTVINSPMEQSICSGGTSAEVVLQSNVSGTTFDWTAAASPNTLVFSPASGSIKIPATTITNPTNALGTVTYSITPSGSVGSCPATQRDYLIKVYPKPSISSILTGSVCSHSPFSYDITSDVTGSTFRWSRAAVPGIGNEANPGVDGSSINETLINTTNSAINVTYILTPTGPDPLKCAGVPSNLVVTVKPRPQVNAGTDKTVNCGTNVTLSDATATGGTGAITNYSWEPSTEIDGLSNILTPKTKNLTSTQNFILTVTDAGTCTNSDAVQVTVTGICLDAVP